MGNIIIDFVVHLVAEVPVTNVDCMVDGECVEAHHDIGCLGLDPVRFGYFHLQLFSKR